MRRYTGFLILILTGVKTMIRKLSLQFPKSVVLLLLIIPASPTQAQSEIEAEADRILREMGVFLGEAETFSFHADVAYDEFSFWDQEITFGGIADIAVRRPDGLNVSYKGDDRQSSVVFNGHTLVFHDLRTNLFARLETPGDVDQAVDLLFEKYGTSVPTADLIYSDPYEALIESAQFGVVVGKHFVGGISSHHLAFSGEVLDWQIWIQEGSQPFPLQLVITYKQEPGAPQYRARYSNWNLEPGLNDDHFEFVPPPDAGEMEFLSADQVLSSQEAGQ